MGVTEEQNVRAVFACGAHNAVEIAFHAVILSVGEEQAVSRDGLLPCGRHIARTEVAVAPHGVKCAVGESRRRRLRFAQPVAEMDDDRRVRLGRDHVRQRVLVTVGIRNHQNTHKNDLRQKE